MPYINLFGTSYDFHESGPRAWNNDTSHQWVQSVTDSLNGATTGITVYNVCSEAYGAVGDGVTDDTAAIRAAIVDAGEAGGGVVYLPPGEYRVQPQLSGENCLEIAYDNITLMGAGRELTEVKCYVFGGATPNGSTPGTNFEVIDGFVHRGHGIFIASDSIDAMPPRQNITIMNLTLNGQCPRQTDLWPLDGTEGNPPFPADVDTGDGWDTTHQGIQIQQNKRHDNIRVLNCEVKEFRAELVYYGGGTCGTVVVENCKLHDSMGSIVSMTADLTLRNCEIYDGTHGVECSSFNRDITITGNLVYDSCKGIVIPANITYTALPWGKVVIEGNTVKTCPHEGIYITGWEENVTVRNNKVVDCATTIEHGMIRVDDQYDGTPHNILVEDNELIADTASPFAGIYTTLGGTAIAARHVMFRRNRWIQTKYGADNSKIIGMSIRCEISNGSDVTFEANDTTGASYLPTSVSWPPATLALWKNNVMPNDIYTSIKIVGPTGSNPIYFHNDKMALWGENAGYYLVPAIRTTGVKDGQVCKITHYSPDKIGYFNHTTTGIVLKDNRARFIIGTELVIEYDAASGLWVEKDFYNTEAATLTANDCWLASETATNLAPNIHGRGCDSVTLAPTGATDYTDGVDFPPGQPFRIICNANTTIKHNASKLVLASAADFAPGGSGGEITLIRPSTASNKAYELSRFAY